MTIIALMPGFLSIATKAQPYEPDSRDRRHSPAGRSRPSATTWQTNEEALDAISSTIPTHSDTAIPTNLPGARLLYGVADRRTRPSSLSIATRYKTASEASSSGFHSATARRFLDQVSSMASLAHV